SDRCRAGRSVEGSDGGARASIDRKRLQYRISARMSAGRAPRRRSSPGSALKATLYLVTGIGVDLQVGARDVGVGRSNYKGNRKLLCAPGIQGHLPGPAKIEPFMQLTAVWAPFLPLR